MGGKAIDVNQPEWQSEVLGSDAPVLVDFWAEWCGPCKMVSPIVNEIAVEYEGRLRVVKVNADANPEILMEYGVQGIPTLMLFKGGEAIERITGFQPKAKIVGKLVNHL